MLARCWYTNSRYKSTVQYLRIVGASASRSMGPSLYVWDYDGGADDSPEAARRGEQSASAGDLVIDDVLTLEHEPCITYGWIACWKSRNKATRARMGVHEHACKRVVRMFNWIRFQNRPKGGSKPRASSKVCLIIDVPQ